MTAALCTTKGMQDQRDATLLSGCLTTEQAEQAAEKEGLTLGRNTSWGGHSCRRAHIAACLNKSRFPIPPIPKFKLLALARYPFLRVYLSDTRPRHP